MNKKFVWAVVAIVIVLLGYLYASPYLVIHNIKAAAVDGDSEKVSQYIDFPSVRQSFKDQMNMYMLQEISKSKQDGFGALGAMLASSMVDKMIDAVITPEGMTMMLKGKNLMPKQHDSSTSNETQPEQAKPDYQTRYKSLNDFEVLIKDKDSSKEVKIQMERHGLSWKINKIHVPMDN